MDEQSLRLAFSERSLSMKAWGAEVCEAVCQSLAADLGAERPIAYFLKIWPVQARVKGLNSFIRKAFYRGKNYGDPLNDITDQVGVRFVTLLETDVRRVERVVQGCRIWEAEKSRDYEEERAIDPLTFVYQSLHYVVRARGSHSFQGATIPAGAACEVQIRTLLQHAHSELTHDAFYKPSSAEIARDTLLRRQVARSMALIETADLTFSAVMTSIEQFSESLRRPVRDAAALYAQRIGPIEEIDFAMSDFILSSYRDHLEGLTTSAIEAFLLEKPFISGFIREMATRSALFAQPVSLLVTMLIDQFGTVVSADWPLDPEALSPIYAQLGIAEA